MTFLKRGFAAKILFLLVITLFALTGCGANESQTLSPKNEKVPSSSDPSFHAATGPTPLWLRVKASENVIIAKITAIDPLVWTTPDGKEPAEVMDRNYNYVFEQLAPIELNVITTLKGNWGPGKKGTVLEAGAPGSKPYGNHWDFPKVDDTTLWFLGSQQDYRRGTGTEPLVTPNPNGLYKPLANGNWVNTADQNDILDLTQLKQTIQSPLPPTTLIPVSPAPARMQPGPAYIKPSIQSSDPSVVTISKDEVRQN
jgi:uncharacterized protein YcfL